MRLRRQPHKPAKPKAEPVKLKPCPFCGGAASQPDCERAGGSTPRWAIGCAVMYCVSIVRRSRGAAVTDWNTRAGIRPDGSTLNAEGGHNANAG